ncbi:Murein DD-endopeptidase MepM and murein hydrolase activator NlpD, contain LysM domain [Aquimarina amphilecti]|uniref:Murein DD-endopeptidase MepM and murein hydrolase activator NlpD, contain LysM domain n=1 Tax=Aquimarina amphilecti TaxID=1038014 RepID=A0A1H7KGK6_AQUAM|nr:peptidoglycan DD-metalloendopeptidase family protein [Aquimarina amphilecti]SEK85902.1 Murein DD-endopeptidase MepM and murein hydrolase activator NlpD, contain LysM domain [Aquimarina amphilecti]
MKNLGCILLLLVVLISCQQEKKEPVVTVPETIEEIKEPPVVKEFGYNLNNFMVVRDTVRPGDSFGAILDSHGISRAKVFEISNKIKDTFNVARITAGKAYAVLKSKDTTEKAQVFVYQNGLIDYTVVDFRDSIVARKSAKPVKIVERIASGTIESNLSQTFDEMDLSFLVAYKMADIYAWTIDFTRLQAGDQFKVIYTEKYINDTIPAGIGEIKASYFEHRSKPIYAFQFEDDTINRTSDYFDQEANNLRRAFLRAPVQFSRISSRYNLKRRIKYYGNKIRPHRGTDFAAPIGTPILATADGTVTKSERRGGNGKYVKIRHNSTYETQYLHMSRRAVKVGEYVRQGEVIGFIGMTGNTSGPHVCYRFWKNGKEVDPFKQDLPASKPLKDSLRPAFYKHIEPLKTKLDSIIFKPKQEIL